MKATKKSAGIVALVVLIKMVALTGCASAQRSSASALEAALLEELNSVRLKPQEYIAHLEEWQQRFTGQDYRSPEGNSVSTIEGPAALKEAMRALKKMRPVRSLSTSVGITLAAKDHAIDIGSKGMKGHIGSDGSNPFDRLNRRGRWIGSAGEVISYGSRDARTIVMAWLVDDGILERGHRKNILSPEFKFAGISCSSHSTQDTVCVIDLAKEFVDTQ